MVDEMSKRLLIVVDDEPVTSRTLALDLADAGYCVEVAADRTDAFRMMRLESFDLLIAPERRGGAKGLVEELRRVQPGAKVVLMTTDADQNGRGEANDAVERVKKPFDLEEFRAVVERILRSKPEATGSAR
jgi:DNA-binding response OmpR family regulator